MGRELGKVKGQVCLSCGAQASSGDPEAEKSAYQAKGSHMRGRMLHGLGTVNVTPRGETLDPSSCSHKPQEPSTEPTLRGQACKGDPIWPWDGCECGEQGIVLEEA